MTQSNRVSQLLTERLAAEELSEREQRALADHLYGEERAALLAELRASNDEILAQYPVAQMAAQIRQRSVSTGSQPSPHRQIILRFALAAGACLFVALTGVHYFNRSPVRVQNDEGNSHKPWVALKGMEEKLMIHRRADGGEQLLSNRDTIASGDVIQISCASGNARHLVIVSVDGSGAVTLHHPAGKEDSTAVTPGRVFALPFGYELDDAPGFERFILIWTSENLPIDVSDMMHRVKQLRNPETEMLVLPAQLHQHDMLLHKTIVEDAN